ncbi:MULTISPECIES: 2-dehydro-3-deoxyphosphooctonate aldolase [Flavobacterium]|uniref:2-dehydro-3-deoxyphosphooctonate aldolase n=1 Tax=Flavobacterium TaxID=237 RepID=UPI001FCCA086|nr:MULTISPECIES: 2-dehydro-3-deoxyphosphooctonate aldolase [Flavobacterium]UOK42272.1 2-dehydro-3-deoxyphosphooctonate aldolase [Flavobacterium enshiense]
MFKKVFLLNLLFIGLTACISTKSTIQNIDNNAIKPALKDGAFQLKEYTDSKKYAYNQDYPINIGVIQEKNEDQYIGYFFNAITGPNGEKVTYEKVETCCPFPTKYNKIGGGLLSIYEVKWEGQNKPVRLYFNIYERGKIMCPVGFKIKNFQNK